MMNKSSFLLLILVLVISCKKNMSTKPTSESPETQVQNSLIQTEEEKIIRSLRQRSNEAIQFQDTTGITTVWGNDFEMLTSRNQQIKGIENNRRAFAKEFMTKPAVKYIRTPTEIKTFSQWRMASEYGNWQGSWTEPDGLVMIKGTYYAKWHFTGHEWKLRMEVFTAEACTGSKFCDQVPILEEAVSY